MMNFTYISKDRTKVFRFYPIKGNDKTGTGWGVSIFSVAQLRRYQARKHGEKLAYSLFAAILTTLNCLSCPLRHGGCYTHKGHMALGLASQARAILRVGIVNLPVLPDFPELALLQAVKGKFFRFGVYGCPTTLPLEYVHYIRLHAKNYTGYTHEWRDPAKQAYSDYFMASVHNKEQAYLAEAMGWRYFMAVLPEDVPENTVNCPASREAGFKTTCNKCALCSGALKKAKNVHILMH